MTNVQKKKISETKKKQYKNGICSNLKSEVIEIICPIYNEKFLTTNDSHRRKTCSKICGNKLTGLTNTKINTFNAICKQCEKKIYKYPSQRNSHTFCSYDCANK